MDDDKIILTDKGKKVLTYLQDEANRSGSNLDMVGKDIGEATAIKGIYLVLDWLVRRGLVEHGTPVERPFTNNKGETKPKMYQTYRITQFGLLFNIEKKEN